MNKQQIIDEAVRDITNVAVAPVAKSEVRRIITQALAAQKAEFVNSVDYCDEPLTPIEHYTSDIYKIIDAFLVEAKDQDGNERSVERLNEDRHLAVKALITMFKSRDTEWKRKLMELVDDSPEKG